MPDFEIALTNEPSVLEAIYELRYRVHAPTVILDPPARDGLWKDSFEDGSFHFFALADEKVVGAARLTECNALPDAPYGREFGRFFTPGNKQFGVFSRLVVAPEWRKLGIGLKMDQARISLARDLGVSHLLAATRHPRRPLALQAQGFLAISDVGAFTFSQNVSGTAFLLAL